MRISKGTCWVALAASSSCWIWGCGDSSSSAGTAGSTSQAGATSSAGSAGNAGSATVSGGGAAAHAGNTGGAGRGNTGGAGRGNTGGAGGGAGAHSGGAPGAAGAAGAAGGGAGAHGGGAPGAAGTTGAAGSGGSGGAVKSAGCGKSAPLSAATQQSVMIDSATRGYFLAPPTPYDNGTPYAVVFAYHGSGGSGSSFRPAGGVEGAAANQAIFVYPDGAGGIWDLKNNGSDAKLFDAILATLSANWCIDTGAVFAVGFSYGGWAATQMASARPAAVRAVASIEGGGPQAASNSDPAVAAMIIHGKDDTAEPLASGESSRDHFLKTNGCGNTSSPLNPAPCVTYSGCKPKKSVAWCQHDGGHEIPAFSAAGIWAFFNGAR